ncbi:MAG: hypothetical protein J0I06_28315 [Planctomycetes bacterium]|nr:hypothetical protein [Planctomycetota bacterium]
MIVTRSIAAAVAGAALAALAGCGKEPAGRVPVYPVTGSVLAKGKGVPHARVTFVALARQDGPALDTDFLTDPSGNFAATTYKPGDGLPPGRYAVFVQWPETVTDDPALGGDRLHGRYSDRKKPVFTVEVKAEPNSLPPFDVK